MGSSQPIICVPKQTHWVVSQNSPSLPQNSVGLSEFSSTTQYSVVELLFRGFKCYYLGQVISYFLGQVQSTCFCGGFSSFFNFQLSFWILAFSPVLSQFSRNSAFLKLCDEFVCFELTLQILCTSALQKHYKKSGCKGFGVFSCQKTRKQENFCQLETRGFVFLGPLKIPFRDCQLY